jgi:Zn-dependent protease
MLEWYYTIMIIIWVLALVTAITIHEAAHAWMADKLGDPTARIKGRLSLNPLVHYDTVGTTILLVSSLMRALGAPIIPFGWAKPVEFDPYNLKNPKKDSALISFAGPLSNILLSVVLSIIMHLSPSLVIFLLPFVVLNISLAIFNLIPIHPLDGGKILVGLLPNKESYEVDRFLHRFGTILLIFLILPSVGGNSLVSIIISPVVNTILALLIP